MTRIVEAAQMLLLERAPGEARVVDICRAAGVTVGGFYSRFADKEALLDHLEERARDEFVRFVTDLAETAEIVRPDLATYLGALLRGLAEAYERNGGIVRRMVERAQRDSGLRRRLVAVNRQNMDRTMTVISTLGEVDHPQPEVALEFALLAQRSILREALLFPDAWGAQRIAGREALIAEIRRMMVRYLGLEEGAPEPRAGG